MKNRHGIDGSALIGAIKSGETTGLSLDSSGNLMTSSTSDISIGTTGSAVPADAVYLGGNKSGNLAGLLLDSLGRLKVAVANNDLCVNILDYAGGLVPDGTNDFTTAFQNAVNATNLAIGTIDLPSGIYKISNPINITAPIRIMGNGWKSIILIDNGANCYAFSFPGGSAGLSGVQIDHLKIDCNGANQTTGGGGIDTNGAYECAFENLWIHDPWEAGIKLRNGPVSNNSYGFNNTIRSNYIEGGQNSNGGPGRGIWSSNSDENFIVDNSFWNNGVGLSDPCHIRDDSGFQLIRGNAFVNGAVGIKCYSDRTRIIGNTFDGVQGNNVVLVGNKNVIENNLFSSIGHTSSANTITGVWIVGTANSIVSDNYFENDTTASNATEYFINLDTGTTNTLVANNQMIVSSGSVTAKINNLGDGSNTVRSNQGYNPLGIISPPSVPASTVAVAAYPTDMTVYVKGGTLTNIVVGGVSTGISAAAPAGAVHSVRVPAGANIAITYTVAPTWVWSSD